MSDAKWSKDQLEEKVAEFLGSQLAELMENPWVDDKITEISKDISKAVVNDLYNSKQSYKYSAVCVISKKNQYNPKIESACMWDSESDIHVSICQDTYHFFCILNIYAISLDS